MNLDSDFTPHAKAAIGLAILNRLVPAPDHGRGFRRDPETGFVYYSSEWLSDERETPLPDPLGGGNPYRDSYHQRS